MARYKASLQTSLSQEQAFAYLSDFSTTLEWDPGVVEAHRLDSGEVGRGSEFRLGARFLGRTIPLTYRIIEYDPPWGVGFLAENGAVFSLDRIAFAPVGEGTRIVYEAALSARGPLRLADPLLSLAFDRVGDRALAGLRERLGELSAERASAAAARG